MALFIHMGLNKKYFFLHVFVVQFATRNADSE